MAEYVAQAMKPAPQALTLNQQMLANLLRLQAGGARFTQYQRDALAKCKAMEGKYHPEEQQA